MVEISSYALIPVLQKEGRCSQLQKVNICIKTSEFFQTDENFVAPGANTGDTFIWQFQLEGNWHPYGYNACRVIEAAHVAGKNTRD